MGIAQSGGMDLLDIDWEKVESTARGLRGQDTDVTEPAKPRERGTSARSVGWGTTLRTLRGGTVRWLEGTTVHRMKARPLPL